MPPKKDTKKPVQDDTGIMKNYVEFTIKLTIQQCKLENILLYFEWINGDSTEQQDAGYIEDWTKTDPNANPEESFESVFEKTFDSVRIDDKFCKTITNKKLYIYFVNSDDGKILHSFNMDYSILLFEQQYNFKNDKNKIMAIENFQLQITTDKPLLTKEFKEQINPLLINIVGAKQVPVNNNKEYQPVYIKYNFFGHQEVISSSLIHGSTLKFNFQHVILLGLLNPFQLKEQINSQVLKVEFHDIDEIIYDNIKQNEEIINVEELIKNENERIQKILQDQQDKLAAAAGGKNVKAPAPAKVQPPAKTAGKDDKKVGKKDKKKDIKGINLVHEPKPNVNSLNYGIAEFFLTDLLKPNFHETKLRSFIYPNKVFEDKQSKNLDLNTTARKDLQKQHLNTTYLDSSAYILMQIKLSDEIGAFVPRPPTQEANKKPDPKAKVQASQASDSQNTVQQSIKPIYERVVFVLPYKSEKFVQTLQDKINEINLRGMNMQEGGLRQLQTYVLSQQERENHNLDFIGGFEIMDNEFRIFVLEGVSTKGMRELEDSTKILEPNTENFKILRNNQILFKDRIYCDFGLDIKKVRLRDNLREFLMKPDIYNRIKLPESICTCFIQFNEIRKCVTLKSVVSMNLFPKSDYIISIERKYSDSLSYEDLNGISDHHSKKSMKQPKSQEQNINNNKQIIQDSQINFTLNLNDLIPKVDSPNETTRKTDNNTLRNTKQIYSMRCTSMDKRDNKEQIFIYGTQKYNCYELQKQELRQKIQKDKNNFYTYSKDYLSLSVDPFSIEDEKNNLKTQEEKLLQKQNRPEFRSISKKKIDVVPKRLHPSQIEEIADNPYYSQKKIDKDFMKTKRGLPLSDPNKAEFQNYILPTHKPFSIPEVMEMEKLTSDEKDKQEKQAVKLQREQFLKKLVGTEFVYTNSVVRDKDSQIDKHKGLRVDDAKKVGFQLKKSQIETSKIKKELYLKDIPASIFCEEKFVENEKNLILDRQNLPQLNMGSKEFFKYTTEMPIDKNQIHKVLKQSEIQKIK